MWRERAHRSVRIRDGGRGGGGEWHWRKRIRKGSADFGASAPVYSPAGGDIVEEHGCLVRCVVILNALSGHRNRSLHGSKRRCCLLRRIALRTNTVLNVGRLLRKITRIWVLGWIRLAPSRPLLRTLRELLMAMRVQVRNKHQSNIPCCNRCALAHIESIIRLMYCCINSNGFPEIYRTITSWCHLHSEMNAITFTK